MANSQRFMNWLILAGAMAMAAPWMFLKLSGFHGSPTVTAALAGLAILGAAFVLSWVAEVAQLDISQALAVAIVALIAVLPEYSVDLFFAWRAGQDPVYAQYALANMTGGNRLLIGVGWTTVVFVYWLRTRRTSLQLHKQEGLETSVLSIATIYAFLIPLKGDLTLIDAGVLIVIFALYVAATAKQPCGELECAGPAKCIAELPVTARRITALLLAAFACFAIAISAEPFAEGLIESGHQFNIDEFLLVQWLAPIASESPEFILAVLFVLRGHARLGLRTMISSKVNQWTLLVGSLPIVFCISAGSIMPMELGTRQSEEVLLTAAQSAFAIALLAGMRFPVWGAALVFGMFAIQLIIPDLREPLSFAYIALAVGIFVFDRSRLRVLFDAPRWLLQRDDMKREP